MSRSATVRSLCVLFLAFLLTSAGCKKASAPGGDGEPRPGASSGSATGALAAAPSAASSAPPAPVSTGSSASHVVDEEQKARLDKYWKAMGQGRMATKNKAFSTARGAFDRALAAMPDDARAYAERGYVQLLAKNFRLAREDFDRAVERTDDRKLLAQIWFNYGLTAEEEGRTDDARSAFARSNEMNPTEAASQRLGGTPTCTARVTETKPEEGAEESHQPSTSVDWLGAFDLMARTMTDATRPGTSDAARRLLCITGDCQPGPDQGVAIRLSSNTQTAFGAVIATSDGRLRPFTRLCTVAAGPCAATSEASVTHQQPLQLRVQTSPMVERFVDAEGHDCREGASETCVRQCRPGTTVVRDYLFNVAGTEVPLEVHQWTPPGGKAPWAVTISGTDARIQGSGCDLSWSLQ